MIQVHDHDGDIVGNDVPANPIREARQAVIKTPRQAPRPSQVTDPAFNAVAEALHRVGWNHSLFYKSSRFSLFMSR